VPEGTARLRISITLNANEESILALFEVLGAERHRAPSSQ
jgi:7-keto-8-aminopelargonate synthetase-like enzyme